MKSIATVNCDLPTIEDRLEYLSGESLRDYDIAIFSSKLPYQTRVEFSGGGSCISIEGARRIQTAISHWRSELRDALGAGKTVFVLLSKLETDQAAQGSTSVKGSITYNTVLIDNYQALPTKMRVRNAKGRQIVLASPLFKGLHEALNDIAEYNVIIDPEIGRKIFQTRDGAEIGAQIQIEGLPGNLILIPYFDFSQLEDSEDDNLSKRSVELSHMLVNQVLALDRALRQRSEGTPPPTWTEDVVKPKKILSIDAKIEGIRGELERLQAQIEAEIHSRNDLSAFSQLLYENGRILEAVIERALRLLGYTVDSIRINDLEIDHVITREGGVRMIGESEGKDSSAIDISKFRQLESNINEDFQRDEIDAPAKGVLFGNGFRFTVPADREEQFTRKCLTNAKRLGTALVRTSNLYLVAVHLLDHPDDDSFKVGCRQALENTAGEMVVFPEPG